jgi:hypothetical protein
MSAPTAPTPTDHEVAAPRRLEGPVRVNLLPQSTRERAKASRQRGAVLAVFVVLLGGIGGAYWLQLGKVDEARAQRDLAMEQVAARQAEVTELAAFQDLQTRVQQVTGALATALGPEISAAGLLQDIAAVTPLDTAVTSIEFTMVDEVVGLDGEVAKPSAARVTVKGETTGELPGVERAILAYEKVVSFFDVYFTSSEIDDQQPDVLLFTFDADLSEGARTGRYLFGVPEELR